MKEYILNLKKMINEKLRRPPHTALKTIQAGRLKGKSDINPQWRMDAMTEAFGMVGIGWCYRITKQWTEAGADGEVMAFCNVKLYIKDGDTWSMPITGTGGSTLVSWEGKDERRRLYNNDEAYKMALTDALSVAMKALGVAGDIYLGLWDGSKYSQPVTEPEPKNPQPEPKLTKKVLTYENLSKILERISNGEPGLIDLTIANYEVMPQQLDQIKAMYELNNHE